MSDENENLPPPSEPNAAPLPPQSPPQGRGDPDGCMVAIGKAILVLVIGIFVLGALVFATCFLSMRR
jgi:hypothetical protein